MLLSCYCVLLLVAGWADGADLGSGTRSSQLRQDIDGAALERIAQRPQQGSELGVRLVVVSFIMFVLL